MQGYEPSSIPPWFTDTEGRGEENMGKIVREHEKRGDPEKRKGKDYFQTQDSMGTS